MDGKDEQEHKEGEKRIRCGLNIDTSSLHLHVSPF